MVEGGVRAASLTTRMMTWRLEEGGRRETSPEAKAAAERVNQSAHHRRIAQEMGAKREKRKIKKKEEAASHVTGWAEAHKTVYEQLASLPTIGPPIFPRIVDGWGGDARRYEIAQARVPSRAAAKLHPDKVADLPLNAQALAEELFKALGEAYQKELKRLEAK